MDKYEGYKIILKEVLSEKRYAHSLSVADTAAKLAIINDADAEKAYLAGLMHDYAKDIPEDKLLAIAQEQGIIKDEAEILAPYILHGPVGAYLLRERKIITDEEILQAIALHTTGAAEMTLLANIIYMADYIEPGRKHGNVDNIRTITYKNLDFGLASCFDSVIMYLISNGSYIHPDSIKARNAVIARINAHNSN